MTSVLISLLAMLRRVVRSRAALHLEILALRHQLQVLQRSRSRRLRLAKTIVERLADAARDREARDGPRQASYISGNPIWPFMPTSSFGCS